jgi:hypothetical protein
MFRYVLHQFSALVAGAWARPTEENRQAPRAEMQIVESERAPSVVVASDHSDLVCPSMLGKELDEIFQFVDRSAYQHNFSGLRTFEQIRKPLQVVLNHFGKDI